MKPLSFSEVNQRGRARRWFIFHVNHYNPLEITNAALYRCNALTLAAGPVAGNPRVMLGREGEVYRERWLTDPSLAASLWSREAWTHTNTPLQEAQTHPPPCRERVSESSDHRGKTHHPTIAASYLSGAAGNGDPVLTGNVTGAVVGRAGT